MIRNGLQGKTPQDSHRPASVTGGAPPSAAARRPTLAVGRLPHEGAGGAAKRLSDKTKGRAPK